MGQLGAELVSMCYGHSGWEAQQRDLICAIQRNSDHADKIGEILRGVQELLLNQTRETELLRPSINTIHKEAADSVAKKSRFGRICSFYPKCQRSYLFLKNTKLESKKRSKERLKITFKRPLSLLTRRNHFKSSLTNFQTNCIICN